MAMIYCSNNGFTVGKLQKINNAKEQPNTQLEFFNKATVFAINPNIVFFIKTLSNSFGLSYPVLVLHTYNTMFSWSICFN